MSVEYSINIFPVTQGDNVLVVLNKQSLNYFTKFCVRENITLSTKLDSLDNICYEIDKHYDGIEVLSRFINSLTGQLTAIINSIDKVLIT